MTTPIRASRNLAGMLVFTLALGAQLACPACRSLHAGEEVSRPDPATAEFFEAKVRPVLAAHCWECHGPQKQKSGLRLDSREAVLRGGETGPAVMVGKAGESLLVEAIGYSGSIQMPPRGKLDSAEIAALTDWVKLGMPWPESRRVRGAEKLDSSPSSSQRSAITAKDRDFWSFRPVRKPQPPVVQDTEWGQSAIDRFILARLEARGLAPAPSADKRTLLRRVTFDLIGLPPTPEEIDAFLADDSPTPSRRWSIGCSRRPITASAGAGTGSTSPATARTRPTPSSPGSTRTATAIATG